MKNKLKNYISFSSFIEEKKYFTQIDLEKEIIIITSGEQQVYEGTIAEFKALEKIKAYNTDRIYESLLSMSEELMHILTKK